MSSGKKKATKSKGLKLLRRGDQRQIVGTEKVLKIYVALERVNPNDFATLDTAFDRWLSRERLTKRQFNSEGRHSVDGKTILLMAFKGGMFRFYGSIIELDGVETFIVVRVEKKKQNKADPSVLDASAKQFREFLD